MKLSRRNILGSLLAIPLVPKAVEAIVQSSEIAERPRNVYAVVRKDGRHIRLGRDLFINKHMDLDGCESGYATFRIPRGAIALGSPINILMDGDVVFQGFAHRLEQRGEYPGEDCVDAVYPWGPTIHYHVRVDGKMIEDATQAIRKSLERQMIYGGSRMRGL